MDILTLREYRTAETVQSAADEVIRLRKLLMRIDGAAQRETQFTKRENHFAVWVREVIKEEMPSEENR